MNSNIQERWRYFLNTARQNWVAEIETVIEPEFNARGIAINSRSGMERDPSYIAIWFCSKGDIYLELMASTSVSFTVKLIRDNKVTWWPSETNPQAYLNYTVEYLLAWLDDQPWIKSV